MAYEIAFADSVKAHLQVLTAGQRVAVLDAIERQLMNEPLTETRNRKPLRPNPVAPWELRAGTLRVFYDVTEGPPPTVRVLAVARIGTYCGELTLGGVSVRGRRRRRGSARRSWRVRRRRCPVATATPTCGASCASPRNTKRESDQTTAARCDGRRSSAVADTRETFRPIPVAGTASALLAACAVSPTGPTAADGSPVAGR